MASAGGVGRWTRSFTVASALSMVLTQAASLASLSTRTVAVVGLFGAVLPMVFGMAYLLLPAYVGRTLSARWLPGVHLVAAYLGAGVLAADTAVGVDPRVVAAGGVLWSAGVVLFAAVLGTTVVPAVVDNPAVVVRTTDRPQRSTRLATAAIPVAVAYLLVGTVALLSRVTPLPALVGASLPSVVHYYAAGFAALLVFSLGARLTTGFFHVSPPRYPTWAVLLSGAVAPGALAGAFFRPPWYLVGAGLQAVAMVGYAGLVGSVALRTDRRRVGLWGIVLGALSGVVGVCAAVLVSVGAVTAPLLAVHVPAVVDGFFLLTIVGYAYQFFPVTSGQFRGATARTALATMLLLAAGTGLEITGAVTGWPRLHAAGAALALVGTAGYAYLMIRRLVSPCGYLH